MKWSSHFNGGSLFLILFISCVLSVKFAPGTKDNDGKNESSEATNLSKDASSTSTQFADLTEADLRRIVAEGPLDDPLNAFFDPHESYRFSNYAYFRPIAFHKEHANPPIPLDFLPPNGPPKSFPNDFFYFDEEIRKLILGEHAATFCPFLRKWREKNPLKPYPIKADFLQKHPPIKFTTKKGYEIDVELARLNNLTKKIQFDIFNRDRENENELNRTSRKGAAGLSAPNDTDTDTPHSTKTSKNSSIDSDCSSTEASDSPRSKKCKNKNKNKNTGKKEKGSREMKLLLKSIKIVKKLRKDCRAVGSFVEDATSSSIKKTSSFRLDAPLSCLEDAILYMDELEDMYYPIKKKEDEQPERLDKISFYSNLLSKLKSSSFDGCGGSKRKEKTNNNNITKSQFTNNNRSNEYNGAVPVWAKISSNSPEILFSDTDEVKLPESYRFSYQQVPFPSIQNTLQKYVGI